MTSTNRPQGRSPTPNDAGAGRNPQPLSFAQERLWFLEQLEPGLSTYNAPLAVRLTGILNLEALDTALNAVVVRHDIIRSVFRSHEGRPYQVVLPARPVRLDLSDLSSASIEQKQRTLRERMSKAASQPFDLGTDPMLRAHIYRLSSTSHVLLLVMHHIATDGWSMNLLLRELAAHYNAALLHRSASLPALPKQYADFAREQRSHLEGEITSRELAYWKGQLAGVSPHLDLPTDYRRSSVSDDHGDTLFTQLPSRVAAQLRTLAHAEQSTLFMALLSVLFVVLHRYSGQEDLTVGIPIAGRTDADLESLIGFFVNMLVIRQRTSGTQTFRRLLHGVRKTCLDAYDHQTLPFERLVALLQPQRMRNRTPFFQISFSYQPAPIHPVHFEGLDLTPVEVPLRSAKFDLSFSVRESGACLAVALTYPMRLFDRGTVERMLEQYVFACSWIAGNPDASLESIPLADEEVRWEAHEALHRAVRHDPIPVTIHEAFSAVAAEFPDRIALRCGDRTVTYRELDRTSEQVAGLVDRLCAGGTGSVGVLMDSSFEMLTAYLAILKAGCCYVPLDPQLPPRRLAQLIQEARVNAVLTLSSLRAPLSLDPSRVIEMDTVMAFADERLTATSRRRNATPQQPAYIMFTSGSAGPPKGVRVPHRGVIRLVRGAEYVRLDQNTRLLQLASPSFDAATFEIWGPLLHGGECILPPSRIPSVSDLSDLLREHAVNTLWLTATWFNTIVDEDVAALSPVEHLLIGGEALSVSHVHRALRALPATTIVNGYGPTENTTFTCCYRIPRALDPNSTAIPIGRPIQNTTVYVLDARRCPTAPGEPGELWIGGAGLADGYVNDPALTSARFILDPFSKGTGDRLYRSGDRVRLRADGNLEFLGRMDRQIKVRGYRVEPAEIEHVLRQHAGVADARVVGIGSEGGASDLVAYLVQKDNRATLADDLRAHLRSRLPDYMVPGAYVCVDEIPRTPTGKIDSERLLQLAHPSASAPPSPDAPRTELEHQMVRIWSHLLEVDRVGIHDSFFDLGGHSLLAVRLFAQIERAFHVRLPLAALFDHPTVAALTRIVADQGVGENRSTAVCLQPGDKGRAFFCVPPAASTVNHFAQIVQQFPDDLPFYAFQALGLEPQEDPQRSIPAMARRYIDDMRAVQPEGPYLIGGRCLGAYVAFEMASQLAAAGERIALLALIDPTAPPGVRPTLRYYIHRAGYFRRHGSLMRAGLRRVRWTLHLVRRLRIRRYVGRGPTRRIERTFSAHRAAQRDYLPPVYPGTITFLASEAEYSPDDSRALWKQYAGNGVDLRLLPGTHRTMAEGAHLAVLVRALEELIRGAREATREP